MQVRLSARKWSGWVRYLSSANGLTLVVAALVAPPAFAVGAGPVFILLAVGLGLGFLLRMHQLDDARRHLLGRPSVVFRASGAEIARLPFDKGPKLAVTRECVLVEALGGFKVSAVADGRRALVCQLDSDSWTVAVTASERGTIHDIEIRQADELVIQRPARGKVTPPTKT